MNKKGMSLIEMVVAIFVISIASLLLFSGFATVLRVLEDANTNKKNSDHLLSYAQRSNNGALRNKITNKKVKNTYQLISDTGKSITINGNYHQLNVKGNDDIYLRMLYNDSQKLVKDTVYYDDAMGNGSAIKKYADELVEGFKLETGWESFPFNDSVKLEMLRKLEGEWPVFAEELLPVDGTYYVKVCYPWDYYPAKGLNMVHDQPLIYLSKDSGDITSMAADDTIHFLYDYEEGKWYYFEGDAYTLSFKELDRVRTSMSINGDNNPLGASPLSWRKFMSHVKSADSGWRVLDINSFLDEETPINMWKLV